MQERVKQKSIKCFGSIALHNFLYGEISTWTYFSTSPVKYTIFRFLNSIQTLCAKIIISRKGDKIFTAYSIFIVEKYVVWNIGPNIIATKINDLGNFCVETCIWLKIARRVLQRSFL